MAKNKKEIVEEVTGLDTSKFTPVATTTAVSTESTQVKVKKITAGTYHGTDGKDPVLGALTVKSGEEVWVSEAKAEQLLTDFPKDWELI